MFVHFFPNSYKFFVCLSVLELAYFHTEIRPIQGYFMLWMIFLHDIFLRHSWDVSTLFPNNYKFLVCLSGHQLAYFLTEIRLLYGYLQFWMRYLSEIFWRQSWDVCTLVPNNFEFLVCLSVCQFANFLRKYFQYRNISSSG